MDLFEDLKGIILEEVTNIENKTHLAIDIDKGNLHDLLRQYLTIMYKLVVPLKPRHVFISNELKSKLSNQEIPDQYLEPFNTIKKKFEKGEDLNPYLSDKAFQPKIQDGLLYDWGIRHLHLSSDKKNPENYLNKRTGYLLIFYLNCDNAYLIDVREHPKGSGWAIEDYIHILDSNWPLLLAKYQLKGMTSTGHLKPEERAKSRETGIITFVEVNGKVFSPPGGGIPTDGSCAAANMKANIIMRKIHEFENTAVNNPEKLDQLLKENGVTPPEFYNLNFS